MCMVAELSARRRQTIEADRRTCLRQLKDNRSIVRRRLEDLRTTADKAGPDDYLDKARQLAQELWSIGGHRDSWMLLWGEYNRVRSRASTPYVLRIGCALARMMLDDNIADRAAQKEFLNIILEQTEILKQRLDQLAR